MSSYRIEVPKLERVTRAIGYVCVFWGWLEAHLGDMILDLAPLNTTKLTKKEIEQIREVILVDTDIRTKIKVLRAVAFIRKFDQSWFNQMDRLLNKIDNDLRAKRNRFVHDIWSTDRRGRLHRHTAHAKLKKPQAFAQKELVTKEMVQVKMREVWSLAKAIISAQIKLVELSIRHDANAKIY